MYHCVTDTFSKEFKMDNLKKKATNKEISAWLQRLLTETPKRENKPGIPEINKVELFTKWRKFVPEEFRNNICPEPAKGVLKRVKKERKQKQAFKTVLKLEAKNEGLQDKSKGDGDPVCISSSVLNRLAEENRASPVQNSSFNLD